MGSRGTAEVARKNMSSENDFPEHLSRVRHFFPPELREFSTGLYINSYKRFEQGAAVL